MCFIGWLGARMLSVDRRGTCMVLIQNHMGYDGKWALDGGLDRPDVMWYTIRSGRVNEVSGSKVHPSRMAKESFCQF